MVLVIYQIQFEAAEPTFFLRTNPDGSTYSIPDVVDNTPTFPYDYRYGIWN